MSTVSLSNLRKSYGSLEVIHGVDLEVSSGEFVVFVGPSGCGKSTLLRLIAGLESISTGEISIDGSVVNDISSSKRGIAMVFQSYALYPHMNVYQNMAFGLELNRTPKAEVDRRVRDAARILQIDPYLERMPKALSGGQRQRVAIGRAIVRNPSVFLFDEPLSNLDAALRTQTRVELAQLHKSLGTTMIYVTHDQTEAMTLADRIVVMNAGRIEQVGTPLELYRKPHNTFVAGFIANQRMNFLPVEPVLNSERSGVRLPNGKLLANTHKRLKDVKTIGVRPEDLTLAPDGEGPFSGTVEIVEHLGEYALVHVLMADEFKMTFKVHGAPDLTTGAPLSASARAGTTHLFDDNGLCL